MRPQGITDGVGDAGWTTRRALCSSFGFLERWHFHLRAPWWCRLSLDELMLIYRDQRLLREDGLVVWGAIVQANNFLYGPGRYDCPATVIYSPDLDWSDWLWPLTELAKELYALKGYASYDPAEREYGQMLADEKDRAMGICVPQWIAQGVDVRSTTVMVHRKHLPAGYLARSYFPLLMHAKSKAALLLPARYWSDELLADWDA
jgi:hypothetical protein